MTPRWFVAGRQEGANAPARAGRRGADAAASEVTVGFRLYAGLHRPRQRRGAQDVLQHRARPAGRRLARLGAPVVVDSRRLQRSSAANGAIPAHVGLEIANQPRCLQSASLEAPRDSRLLHLRPRLRPRDARHRNHQSRARSATRTRGSSSAPRCPSGFSNVRPRSDSSSSRATTDTGMAQIDSLRSTMRETAPSARATSTARSPIASEAKSRVLDALGARLVVGDIPPLAFAAAAAGGRAVDGASRTSRGTGSTALSGVRVLAPEVIASIARCLRRDVAGAPTALPRRLRDHAVGHTRRSAGGSTLAREPPRDTASPRPRRRAAGRARVVRRSWRAAAVRRACTRQRHDAGRHRTKSVRRS